MVPFPKCYGPSLSINKLSLNEPAINVLQYLLRFCVCLLQKLPTTTDTGFQLRHSSSARSSVQYSCDISFQAIAWKKWKSRFCNLILWNILWKEFPVPVAHHYNWLGCMSQAVQFLGYRTYLGISFSWICGFVYTYHFLYFPCLQYLIPVQTMAWQNKTCSEKSQRNRNINSCDGNFYFRFSK